MLIFATHNKNKVKEISALIPSSYHLRGLADLGYKEEIPETGLTFRENAFLKARFVYEKYKINCFADDSGLEVMSLNNALGVYSARYAGEPKNDEANIKKL